MVQGIVEAIKQNAASMADKTAIQSKKESITYKELWEKTQVLAGYLKTCGIQNGDRIILEAVPETSYVICYLALQLIGAVTAPVERGVRTDLLKYNIENLNAKCYISKKDNRVSNVMLKFYEPLLEEAQKWNCKLDVVQYPKDKISEIIFTTGTTGKPKAAMHSVAGITCNTSNTIEGTGMLSTDIILLPLPLNHSFGMRVLRSALTIGATIVLQSGAIFAEVLIRAIHQYKCTVLACVSATMEAVLKEIGEENVSKEFAGLRYIEFSAGAVPVYMREKLCKLLPDTQIHNTWGSTESGGCLFLNVQKTPEKIQAVGKSLPTIPLGIYSEEKKSFIEGNGKENVGRLAISGEMIFKGYWNEQEKYAEATRNGWLLTNDLVWRDEDGYYYMLGRADDVINVGGEKVTASEIENAVMGIDTLKDCACIGIKDEEGVLGEVPMLLYVEKDTEITVEDLKKVISEKIGVTRLPQKYVCVPVIPRNYMQKKDYKLLKKIYQESGVEGLQKLKFDHAMDASTHNYELNNVVVQTILNRKSKRKFTEEKVPMELVEMLVKMGCCAPSGKNLQTRQFTVLTEDEEIQKLKQVIKKVAGEKKTSFNGFENPPLIILISNDRRNKDGIQDVGVSAENILIAAESYGLGGVWLNPLMEISDEPDIRELLTEYKMPKHHIVWAVMAIGWPSEPAPEFIRKKNEVYYVKKQS